MRSDNDSDSDLVVGLLLGMRIISIAVSIVTTMATVAVAGINPNGPDLALAVAKCGRLYPGHAEHRDVCVRAMRADYCGDGIAHTVAGTPINLYDRAGIQLDAADWRPEAEWTARGASCVSSAASMRRGPLPVGCHVPVRSTCGSSVGSQTIIVTEVSIASR